MACCGQTGGLYSPPTFHMDSTWTPHGMDLIPHGFHMDSTWLPPFHMEYILAEIPLILGPPFHVDSTWTPHGFHMEWSWNIQIPHGMVECPHGVHMECPHGFHMDSTWNASSPHGMSMDPPLEYIQIILVTIK